MPVASIILHGVRPRESPAALEGFADTFGEHGMKRVLAVLAVCVTGLGLGFSGSSPAGGEARAAAIDTGSVQMLPQQPIDSTVVRIGGRNVRIDVSLLRDYLVQSNTLSDVYTQVQLTPVTGVTLPRIDSVRMLAARRPSLETWRPALRQVFTALVGSHATFIASAGPRWAPGTLVTVTIEVRSAGKTTVATFPVRVRSTL